MSDIDNALVFSGFKTNQDLVQKTGVPLVCQITNGTASYYHPNITAAPITNPLIEKEVYYGNVVRIKRLSMWQAIPCYVLYEESTHTCTHYEICDKAKTKNDGCNKLSHRQWSITVG